VVLVTALNYLGIRTVGRFQVFLTALKVAMLAVILALGLAATGRFSPGQPALSVLSGQIGLAAFLTALAPVLSAYNGFQFLGAVGGEVVNPRKNLPRAAVLGTATVIGLYVLVNWVYFRLLSIAEVAQSQHVASDAVARLLGDIGAKWFTVAMIVSAFGSLHANLLTGPGFHTPWPGMGTSSISQDESTQHFALQAAL
jgi:APA family basic amino acid/polyamine antiporter